MTDFASFNPDECIDPPLADGADKRRNDKLRTDICPGRAPLNRFIFNPPPNTTQSNANRREDGSVELDAEGQLAIHKKIVKRLDGFIEQNKIPHIIFHGPSGAGKLTLVKEFIHRIYRGDKTKVKSHVMTVNCSHGKGIQFIREELKFFAKANTQSALSSQPTEEKKGCDFKIILLLNAHHLTVDAQSALRRCIELFSYNTRFFIVLENKNKLLNPILSRFCDIFVPEPLDLNDRKPINLHQYVLRTQFQSAHFWTDTLAEIDEHLGERMIRDEKEMMELVVRMYECGISCMDLMCWVSRRKDRWSELEHSRAVMLFHEIKPQFRCEKLLMLYMLNFLYVNKNTNKNANINVNGSVIKTTDQD